MAAETETSPAPLSAPVASFELREVFSFAEPPCPYADSELKDAFFVGVDAGAKAAREAAQQTPAISDPSLTLYRTPGGDGYYANTGTRLCGSEIDPVEGFNPVERIAVDRIVGERMYVTLFVDVSGTCESEFVDGKFGRYVCEHGQDQDQHLQGVKWVMEPVPPPPYSIQTAIELGLVKADEWDHVQEHYKEGVRS